ncbi:MAG: hypothetical protein J6S49_03855, partial [Erysipelotrichaceae bacterium]|nr:hypothetical protein [Erysipelotrichaceae bacterium]
TFYQWLKIYEENKENSDETDIFLPQNKDMTAPSFIMISDPLEIYNKHCSKIQTCMSEYSDRF